ncbi:hypothetical protein [Aegicerativicinus sediminis]
MKKFLIGLLIIITLFIILLYWSLNSTPKDYKKGDIIGVESLDKIDFQKTDSVLIAASTLYKGDMLKEIMQGEHYRAAWETPVKVPVVFLDSLKGGLTPVKEGGGMQTHSLKVLDKDGILYTFRSINKDPEPLVPDVAKTLGMENIIIDGISAQHPYAAIVVARLADEIDILHTHPQAVFVPKQKALGKYDDEYGNALYLFEYETEGDKNWTQFSNVKELVDTKDLQEIKAEGKKQITFDQNMLVRSRLFDMIIGDWDRHAEQWGWALQENDTLINAIPIPSDRDNAFFHLDGIIPSIISNEKVKPELRSFEETIDHMPGLVKRFDRYFLLHVPMDVFMKEAKNIQENLTDDAIAKAFNVWPKELYDLDGESIISKIKSRRDNILKYAEDFKNSIDKQGELSEPIMGSEELELPENVFRCFDCN